MAFCCIKFKRPCSNHTLSNTTVKNVTILVGLSANILENFVAPIKSLMAKLCHCADEDDDEKDDTNLEDTEGAAEEEQKVEVEMTVESESEAERRSFCNESMDRLVSVLKRQLEPILLFVKKKCKIYCCHCRSIQHDRM